MKAERRPEIEAALRTLDPKIRLYLLHGPDEAGSRELAARLARSLGEDAERTDLSSAVLHSDPARLGDEAAATSLFGGRRYIRVDPATEDCTPAVEALLETGAAGNPVVLLAGQLRKDSTLLKLVTSAPNALACISYVPEGLDADRLAAAAGQAAGLLLSGDVAQRVARAANGDRAVLAREIDKLALFLDAAPDRPRELTHEALDAIGTDLGDDDLSPLINALLGGDPARLEAELRTQGDAQAVQIIRVLLMKLHALAPLCTAIAEGASIQGAMASAGKSLFWKDKPFVSHQLTRWRPNTLARAIDRMSAAERSAKSSTGLGIVGLSADLIDIARQSGRAAG